MYTFTAKLWMTPGEAAWYMITLPPNIAEKISAIPVPFRRGFGARYVSVLIGKSKWQTSIFPDSKTHSYVLPIKKEVRLKNKLQRGENVAVSLELIEL